MATAVLQQSRPQRQPNTHSVTLETLDASTNRFTIRNASGNVVCGLTFDGPQRQAVAEAWILRQLGSREFLRKKPFQVTLKVEAQWILYGDKRQYTINENSEMTAWIWRDNQQQMTRTKP